MKSKLSVYATAAVAAAVLALPASAAASITGIPDRNLGANAPTVPQQPAPPGSPFVPFAPSVGASWPGLSDPMVSPPDPNGAIGPSSYVEIINDKFAIYRRTGAVINAATMAALTGDSGPLSDPMVLWDPNTQRFYYNIWNVAAAGGTNTMDFGFSKTSNPTSIPGSFCNYGAGFGYSSAEVPDYPKLGQSQGFLMIGVNHYPTVSALHADRSDLLWISKPQGSAPITTCPAASSFTHGIFKNLRNQNGSQAWTPVPAIQDDSSSSGWIVTSSDIECPNICGTGTLITVHTLTPSTKNPKIPVLNTTGRSITVPSFQPPFQKTVSGGVPQKGSTTVLDPLDGRLEHAVAAVDPKLSKEVIWTGHNVRSAGNRTEFRWYEILPTPVATPTLVSSGVVNSASLFVFNGAVAPDRTVNPSGAAHGDSIVIGFTTSSSTTLPADRMVSKVGSGALSPFVLVDQSLTPDTDFTCSPCRWGDYGGATSDPAQSLSAPHGEVWLSNEAVTAGLNTTWNWEAKP
jgi:hypothetical protein